MIENLITLTIYYSPLIILCLYKYYKRSKLFDIIKYCAGSDPGFLLSRIRSSSNNIEIDCLINSSDISYAEDILSSYQRDISRLYWKDDLTSSFRFITMQDTDYFFFSLFCYLQKHKSDYFIGDNKMQTYLSKEDNGICIHQLTDYGVVFYKIMYISKFYCLNNKRLKNLFINHDLLDIKEHIISKIII